MSLLPTFLSILMDWRNLFCKKSSFLSAIFHSIASLTGCGRKTITYFIELMGEQQRDWSRHYKLYSRSPWDPQKLFYPVMKRSLQFFDKSYITLVGDYTGVRKSGKHIANTGWQRDPMSPKWRPNLRWGLTFMQIAASLPLYEKENLPARSLPIRWVNLKRMPKPSKRASEKEFLTYKQFCKENNRSKIFIQELASLREAFDQMGASNKQLLVSLDGEFCNKTILNSQFYSSRAQKY